MSDPNCLFCKIVRGEIPGRKVYEDEEILAFHDIQPVAPVHFMLVPKKHIASLYEVTQDDAPVLITATASPILDVYDVASGKLVRTIEGIGQTPLLLHTMPVKPH